MKTTRPAIILTFCAWLMTSCTEEYPLSSEGDKFISTENIAFNISEQKGSRSDESITCNSFVLKNNGNNEDSLFVIPTISNINNVSSRGSETNTESLSNFGVSCYVNKNDASAIDPEFLYFSQDEYTKNGSNWTNSTGNEHYWLASDYDYYFYAYWPINSENRTFTDNKNSIFEYTVPQSATNQEDLLAYYATTENSASVDPNAYYQQTVNLPFMHIMSEISIIQGSDIALGSIYSVEIAGFKSNGTYNISTNQWTLTGESTNAYTLNLTTNNVGTATSPGVSLSGTNKNFFILPQTVSDATLTVVYAGSDGVKKTFTAQLPETQFEQGKKYTYTITVNPDMSIEIADADLMQDAHYVIMQGGKVKVNIANLPTSKTATLRATVAEGDASEPVTVQLEENLNSFAQNGFWTDYYLVNNANTIDYNSSARGNRDGSLTGLSNGEYSIAVFIPENKGDINKQIKLSLYVGDSTTPVATKTITQYYPEWVGTYGWERMSDSETVQYGFDWNRISIYVFPYNCNNTGLGVHYTNSQAQTLIQGIIDNFDAGAYASYHSYSVGLLQTRYYIKIDYSKLNNLEGQADNTSDGLANTKALNTFGGAASTSAFEDYVTNTYKTESGHENERMFRDRADTDPSSVPYPSGNNDMESGLLNYTLKLNKYYVKRTSTEIGSSTAPYIFQDDIVWYAPAYGQFSSLPTITNPITAPASYWSSTASTGTNSFLGSGTVDSRTSYHSLRCCRTKP